MLLDVNLLLYAANRSAPDHERAAAWLTQQLTGDQRVGVPWETLIAFVRLVTNPRILARPLPATDAWAFVDEWLAVPSVWIPQPTDRHGLVLGELLRRYRLAGKLVPDAHLAAIAIQHGLDVYSTDTDFARFSEIRWINPLAE